MAQIKQSSIIDNSTVKQAGLTSKATTRTNTPRIPESRRHLLLLTGLAVVGCRSQAANAVSVKNIVRDQVRPDIDYQESLVQLLDAKSVLMQIKVLSEEPEDSPLRMKTRSKLPRWASKLRNVGKAAPSFVASVKGMDKEQLIPAEFGGIGSNESKEVDGLYQSVGKVLTMTGVTIDSAALSDSYQSQFALDKLSQLLALAPRQDLIDAEEARRQKYLKK